MMTGSYAAGETEESIQTLERMGKAFASIAEDASPAVVGIKATRVITQEYQPFRDFPFGSPFGDDFFDRFFRRESPRREPRERKFERKAQGSGFIVSADGYILTNNHLVGEADKVKVSLADGRELTAETVGTDPGSDVAVIKVDAEDLPHLKMADSDGLEVGEWVIAIGNPFGLSHTVTAGIVSAKGRSGIGVTAYEDFIQTDAAINPGNSGGPLLNLEGKVVGINTAIIGSRGNIGIGLAIPINMAKYIYEQLKEKGEVVRGYLGVLPQDLTDQLAKAFDLDTTEGVLIAQVEPDTPAEKAGFKQGDIVVELNGEPVKNADTFRNRIAMYKPGSEIKVVVLRDGERKTLAVELAERPGREELMGKGQAAREELGITVENLTSDLAERLGYEDMHGVVVTGVERGSLASEVGIERGMLIQEVNRQRVKNVDDFNEAMEKASEEGRVVLLIFNGQYSQYVAIPLSEE
jgi:serine protease Do